MLSWELATQKLILSQNSLQELEFGWTQNTTLDTAHVPHPELLEEVPRTHQLVWSHTGLLGGGASGSA